MNDECVLNSILLDTVNLGSVNEVDCELNLLNSKTPTFCATQKLTPRKNKKMFFSFLPGMPKMPFIS